MNNSLSNFDSEIKVLISAQGKDSGRGGTREVVFANLQCVDCVKTQDYYTISTCTLYAQHLVLKPPLILTMEEGRGKTQTAL